jgi:hypothetical protein
MMTELTKNKQKITDNHSAKREPSLIVGGFGSGDRVRCGLVVVAAAILHQKTKRYCEA